MTTTERDHTPRERGVVQRFQDVIERVGGRLPEPFVLFLILFGLLAVASSAMAWSGVSVTMPGGGREIAIRGAFTPEGVRYLFTTLADNFVEFPPVKYVVTIMLAVGVAQHTGLLMACMRGIAGAVPRWLLPYAVGAIGVSASLMSSAAFIVVPPLAAAAFAATRRHPVAGLLCGFASVGAGYSTSLVVTGLDALFAGITTKITSTLPFAGTPVTAVSNLYVNIASALLLGLLAGWITVQVTEPALERSGVSRLPLGGSDGEPTVTSLGITERRGLLWAGVATAGLTAAVLALVLMPGSPLRNARGALLPTSPLLDSVVTLSFLGFLVPALVYGVVVGTVRTSGDIPALMTAAMRDIAGFLVLAFVLAQFTALFAWSRIGSWLAVVGSDGLRALGITGFAAILGFLVLVSVLNMFIVSGAPLWTLMAGIFVPMFLALGLEPGFVQAAFRIGDSATQLLTPLNPYLLALLAFVRRYEPSAGLGTVIARMVPFVVPFWLLWTAMLAVFYFTGIPIGPGMGAHTAP